MSYFEMQKMVILSYYNNTHSSRKNFLYDILKLKCHYLGLNDLKYTQRTNSLNILMVFLIDKHVRRGTDNTLHYVKNYIDVSEVISRKEILNK